jgi:3-hydroxybutyryl-CoA dehydrogenase
MKTIGVIGAGVMGAGVAQDLVWHGYRVVVVDLHENQLEKSKTAVAKGLRFHPMLTGKKAPEPAQEMMARIHWTTDYQDLKEAEFVVENTTEKWDVKETVYPILNNSISPDTVIAANTSAVLIGRMAGLVQNPERVIGIHFMNPVPMKSMVEVIRAPLTSDSTLATTGALLESLSKSYVVVKDSPGFVSNRVLMLTVNEAIHLVHEGVSSAADVDRLFRGCFEHKMGPLETADLIGLDTILNTLVVLQQQTGQDKYQPCPLLQELVAQGKNGRKSGQGFYPYQGAGAAF